jgi:hypothetical protein
VETGQVTGVRLVQLALAAALVAGVATPAPASALSLSYDLTITGHWFFGTHPSGAIVGTLGGLAVDGGYAGGSWQLTVHRHRVAAGTYECIRECRFFGTMLAGRPRAYEWRVPVPTWESSTARERRNLPRVV